MNNAMKLKSRTMVFLFLRLSPQKMEQILHTPTSLGMQYPKGSSYMNYLFGEQG